MAHSAQAQQAPPPKRGRNDNDRERSRRREERPARDRREPERIFPDPKLLLHSIGFTKFIKR